MPPIEVPLDIILSDTPEGWSLFYSLIYDQVPPDHAYQWAVDAYKARKEGKGALIEAFAGSTKTTTLASMYAYQMGLYPDRANLHIGSTEDAAGDMGAMVADIIANNPAWKAVFPNVAPDSTKGWSASGYEIKRLDVPYEEWSRLNAARKDASLLCLAYGSRDLPGRHPDGMMGMDDLDNEDNTTSARERKNQRAILQGTIFSRIVPSKTWIWYIGTPWDPDDTIHYLKSTGRFNHSKTPITKDGTATGEPTWPSKYGPKEIRELQDVMAQGQFARFMLLNLEAAKGAKLKLEWIHRYPHSEINPSWPVVMGVDYASASDKTQTSRDYFALAVGRLIPGGGVVLVDGFRGHLSQGESEQRVKAIAAAYPTLTLIGVEAIGKGEEFYNLLLRTTTLPVMPCQTGGKKKGQRFEIQMAPLFQFSRAWVSTAQSEFLQAFFDEWASWDGEQRVGMHDDCLDAVYYMLAVAQGSLQMPEGQELPAPNRRAWWEKKKIKNPYASLGAK